MSRPVYRAAWIVAALGLVAVQGAPPPAWRPDTAPLKADVRTALDRAHDYFDRQIGPLRGPQRGAAWGRLGMVYQAFRFQPAARAAYEQAVRLDPGDPHWRYYLGVYYEEVGAFAAAMEDYRAALTRAPKYVAGWVRLGEVALEAEQPTAAQQAFTRALTLKDDQAAAIAGLGVVAQRRGQDAVAITQLEKALRLQPEAAQLHYRLGQLYRKRGALEKARGHLARRGERVVSTLDPWIEIMKARALGAAHFVSLGDKSLAAGQPARAFTRLKLALAIDPEDVEALVAMARVLHELQRDAPARKAVRRALALAPGHAGARELAATLGWP